MAARISVGVLGCGHIGQVHLQSALAMDDVDVVAIADKDASLRGRASAQGVPQTYEDYDQLLEEESIDAVVVTLPPSLHVEATRAAAERGCDVFLEKPFARTVAEAESIRDVGERRGINIGVDHTWRYYPHVKKVKSQLDSGAVGHVPTCSIARFNSGPFSLPPVTSPLSEWKLDRDATGGGALLSLGTHMFDVLKWLFGKQTVRHVELGRQLSLPFEDTATVVLESGTGTISTMKCGIYQWTSSPDVNMRLRLEGIAGTLDASDHVPDDLYTHAAWEMVKNIGRRFSGRDVKQYAPTYFLVAHYDALADFLTSVGSGTPPPVNAHDGLRSIELVERAYERADAEWIDT